MHRQMTLDYETTIEYFVNAAKKYVPKDYNMRALKNHISESITILTQKRAGDSFDKISLSLSVSREWIKEVNDQYVDKLIKRLQQRDKESTTPFFVKKKDGNKISWIDINSGVQYDKVNIPYDEADHGLCTPDSRVFKLPNERVVIAATTPEPMFIDKPINISYMDGKHLLHEKFDSHQLYEAKLGLDEGLSAKQIAVRVCSSMAAVEELLLKLESLGGDMKNERAKLHKVKRRRKDRGGSHTKRRTDDIRRSRNYSAGHGTNSKRDRA